MMGHSKAESLSDRQRARSAVASIYGAIDRQPHVVGVEWLEQGVIVGFDDGRTALYPAELLYAIFHQAEELL